MNHLTQKSLLVLAMFATTVPFALADDTLEQPTTEATVITVTADETADTNVDVTADATSESTSDVNEEDINTDSTTEESDQGDTATADEQAGETNGKASIQINVNEGVDEDGNPTVTVKMEKNGEILSDEEVEAELEDWEKEVMETLDEVFRGNPRKGIYALQQDRDSGFVEFGFGMKNSSSETMMRDSYKGLKFSSELNAGLQISGLFFEYFSASPNRALFGLNFFNSDFLGLDIIIGKEHRDFATDKEDTLLLPINVRHADFTGGIRSTIDLGPLVVQGQLRKEITDHHEGYTGSLQAGASVQIKNLNLHAVAGVHYQSEEVMDYYYGVTSAEANADFAAYDPGEDITYTAEVGASYPVGESWVLRGQVNYTQYSEDMANTPFWTEHETEHLSTGLSLVLVL